MCNVIVRDKWANFFENPTGNVVTVNAERCEEVLFTPQLACFPVNENTLFQQDGAMFCTARISMNTVNAFVSKPGHFQKLG